MDLDKYIKRSEKAGPSFALRNRGKPLERKDTFERMEKPKWVEIQKRCLQCNKPISKENNLLYPRFCSETCKERYLTGV